MQYFRMLPRQYYSEELLNFSIINLCKQVQKSLSATSAPSVISTKNSCNLTSSAPNYKRYGRPRVTKQRNKLTEDDTRYNFEKYKIFKTN